MRAALWIALILLVPSAVADPWHWPGGNPPDSRQLGAEGFFDVYGRANLLPEGWLEMAPLSRPVPTDFGIAAVAWSAGNTSLNNGAADTGGLTGTCQVVLWPGPGAEAKAVGPEIPCRQSPVTDVPARELIGYDAERQLLWMCAADDAGTPLVAMALPSGEIVHQIGPDAPGKWWCRGAGWDPTNSELCVPFFDGSRLTLATTSLADGSFEWQQGVGPSALGLSAENETASNPFAAIACVATASGYLVTWSVATWPGPVAQWTHEYATFDRAGDYVSGLSSIVLGALTPVDVRGVGNSNGWLSLRPTVQNEMSYFLMLDQLFQVDPGHSDIFYEPVDDARWLSFLGPASSGPGLRVFPVAYGLVIDREGEDIRYVYDSRGWRVAETAIAADGNLVLLVIEPGPPRTAIIQVMDPVSTHLSQRLNLDLEVRSYQAWNRMPTMSDVGDGRIVVLEGNGGAVVIGPARGDLELAISDPYPASRDEVRLQLPGGTNRFSIAWGDGVVETAQEGEVSHRYAEEGAHTIVVTAYNDDGTTQTDVRVIHVGGNPPANALQRAFADENQDLTFGILGVGLTLFAALIAFLVRWQLRSRLTSRFAELDRIRESGRAQPLPAVAELASYRADLRAALTKGQLMDSQFAAVELRARDVLSQLRKRLLGPFAGKMDPSFAATMDAALEDGHISADERSRLESSLRNNRNLTRHDKEQVRVLLAAMD